MGAIFEEFPSKMDTEIAENCAPRIRESPKSSDREKYVILEPRERLEVEELVACLRKFPETREDSFGYDEEVMSYFGVGMKAGEEEGSFGSSSLKSSEFSERNSQPLGAVSSKVVKSPLRTVVKMARVRLVLPSVKVFNFWLYSVASDANRNIFEFCLHVL